MKPQQTRRLPFADSEEVRERRADEWRLFRRNHLFTQRHLADITGISRRTLQLIEAARITPQPTTLRKFMLYKVKCERNRDRHYPSV